MQNDNSTLKKRLAEFLAYLDIGQAKFAEIVGLSKGFANNIGKSIRTDNLQKIADHYPQLDTDWLLYGKGEMLKTGDIAQTISGGSQRSVSQVGNVYGDNVDNHGLNGENLLAMIEERFKYIKDKDEQVSRLISQTESREEYIKQMTSAAFHRKEEDDKRIDRLILEMNEDRKKSREQMDRVLSMLEKKLLNDK